MTPDEKRIVEWLREQSSELGWGNNAFTVLDLARRIESGCHRKDKL